MSLSQFKIRLHILQLKISFNIKITILNAKQ